MSNRIQSSLNSSNANKIPFQFNPNVGIVVDVILDDTHKRLSQIEDNEAFSTGINTIEVGYCIIRPLSNQTVSEADLLPYPPYDSLNLDLPLIGETVELLKIGNISYYRRLTIDNLNIGNANLNFNRDVWPGAVEAYFILVYHRPRNYAWRSFVLLFQF